jgi:hypothetical protein
MREKECEGSRSGRVDPPTLSAPSTRSTPMIGIIVAGF